MLIPTDADNLVLRRPALRAAMQWFTPMARVAPDMNAASQQLFARICRQTWKVMQTYIQADAASPVGQIVQLQRVMSGFRWWTMVYGRFYTQATGAVNLSLTASAQGALTQLELYDPLFQSAPSFDLTTTLLLVYRGCRVQ